MAKRGRKQTYTDKQLVETVKGYLEDWKAGDQQLPLSIMKCACMIGIARSTLYERAGQCKELSDTLKQIQDNEIVNLYEGGLTGRYNASVTIFRLKNCGESDQPKEETDTTIKVVMQKADEYSE